MTVKDLAKVLADGTFVAVNYNGDIKFSGRVELIRSKKIYWASAQVAEVKVSNDLTKATVIYTK